MDEMRPIIYNISEIRTENFLHVTTAYNGLVCEIESADASHFY
jgi:hypothetical protein